MKKLICLLFFTTLFLAGCSRPIGPAIVNASGLQIEIVTEYEDGRRIDGKLEDGRLLWAGRPDAQIVRLSVKVGEYSFSTASDELRIPLPGDKWPAFVVRKNGLKKVRLDEALKLTAIK
ncbi:MAG TPA: hypothetical protein VGD81_05690 [Opitutaceae bacterium]